MQKKKTVAGNITANSTILTEAIERHSGNYTDLQIMPNFTRHTCGIEPDEYTSFNKTFQVWLPNVLSWKQNANCISHGQGC